jgi:hypothetical protein
MKTDIVIASKVTKVTVRENKNKITKAYNQKPLDMKL